MSDARVLVVDDDEGIRELVTLVLSDEGYEVVGVPNGELALEALREFDPAVILLDTRMPVMDGVAFARAYHGRASSGGRAAIIVLTGAADIDSVAEEIMADAMLQKPFDLDDLLTLVGRFTAPPGTLSV